MTVFKHKWTPVHEPKMSYHVCLICGIDDVQASVFNTFTCHIAEMRYNSIKITAATEIAKDDTTSAKILGTYEDAFYGNVYTVKPDKCECGAHKIGINKGMAGHSSWCPWTSS